MRNKINHSEGYILIYKPDHPYCSSQGYVPEHRLVLEKHLNKIINSKKYAVHHIDGNKRNNNIKNLQVLTPLEHLRIHHGYKKINNKWMKNCCKCNRFLNALEKLYVKVE